MRALHVSNRARFLPLLRRTPPEEEEEWEEEEEQYGYITPGSSIL